MKFALVAVLALLPLVVAQVPIPYTNCGSPTDHVKIQSATASVWPPVLGQDTTLVIQATLDETVSGGTYIAQASFDGFPVLNQQGSLSDLNVTFPIAAGPVTINKTVNLPSIIPAGSTVVANVSALDSNGQELLCLGLTVQIPSMEELITTDEQTALFPDEEEQEQIELEDQMDQEEGDLSDLTVLFNGEETETTVTAEEKMTFGSIMESISEIFSGETNFYDGKLNLDDPVPVPYTNCGQASDVITINSVTSTVWPPAPGVTATVVANFLVHEQVNDGTYNAQVSVDGFPLINTNGTISDFVTLPIAKGPLAMTKTVTLPSSIPFSGSIGIQVAAGDKAGEELFCIGISFNL